MRWSGVVVLGGALLCSSGCVGSIVKTLVAPESVLTEAGSALAEAGAQTLSGASLDELADLNETVKELDRILQENPDAVNAEQLKSLRDGLKDGTAANTGPDQRQPVKQPPKPRRPVDAPLPARKADRLTVIPPGETVAARRPPARPDTLPDGSSLRPDPTPVHTMSLKPVRLPR